MANLNCTVGDSDTDNTACVWFTDIKTRPKISLFTFDSTGPKSTNRGDWITAKCGVRRQLIKLHIGVDADTEEIYTVAITDDKCGGSSQFEELVEQAFENAERSPNVHISAGTKVAADGAYDTRDIHNYCDKHAIGPLILVRSNLAGDTNRSMPCKKAGFKQLGNFDDINKRT